MALSKDSRLRSLPPADEIPEREYDEPIKLKALQAPVVTGAPPPPAAASPVLPLSAQGRTDAGEAQPAAPPGCYQTTKRLPIMLPARRPFCAGTMLKLFLLLVEGPLGGPIIRKLMRNNGLPQVGGLLVRLQVQGPCAGCAGLQGPARWVGGRAAAAMREISSLTAPCTASRGGRRIGTTGTALPLSRFQILEELYIPEAPTFRPNTAGWRAEDDVAWDLVRRCRCLCFNGCHACACSLPCKLAWSCICSCGRGARSVCFDRNCRCHRACWAALRAGATAGA